MSKRIDWWTPVMGAREKALVCEVIDRNFPNDGEYTTAFEQRIAALCEVPYAVAVTSGTAAIFVALAACDVGPGDEVIVPDLTFIATANAVKLASASPILVDVDPRTFCIDPDAARTAITARTKAIVPVHVSGRAADMPAILELAGEHGLRVVEDAAEALGSRAHGAPLGSLGDVGCFSFSPNKSITTGQGGVVVTKDPFLYGRLRELKDHGRPVRGTGGADEHVSVGYNFKLTNLQAALGLAQLESFPARRARLCDHFRRYRDRLADNPAVTLPGFDLDAGACPQWIDAVVQDRDGLCDRLLEHEIHAREFWYPLHTQAPYRAPAERFLHSTAVSSSALWLPSALTLTDDDIDAVCDVIAEYYRSKQAPCAPATT